MYRVGGKTWSRPVLGGKSVVDVGAAWINDTNQSRMFNLAKRFGLETVVQNTEGDVIMHEGSDNIHRFEYGSVPKVLVFLDTVLTLC